MAFRRRRGRRQFFASAGGLYDVTAQGAPLAPPVYSGAASNRWNYTAFANPAGAWLIAVNGTDTPIGYNADAWAPLPAITGSSGLITLDPTRLFAVLFPHQGCLLFAEADSLHVWFPAAARPAARCNSSTSAPSSTRAGGSPVANWSWQFGVTADDAPSSY